MKKQRIIMPALLLTAAMLLGGCGTEQGQQTAAERGQEDQETAGGEETMETVTPAADIQELEDGFSTVRFDGDYAFDAFLEQGGASSDGEVIAFLKNTLLGNAEVGYQEQAFGCSTIAAENEEGQRLFGRNFDWNSCNAMVVESHPEQGYASLSTVNLDFISQGAGALTGLALKLDSVRTMAALYAPLDGMNERGLAVSVNMIQDSATIEQDTEKPDITTTTAIRLLLDKAADVDEALDLLEAYDLHASMGMMVHFALADASGRSVVVEYIGNEMNVVDTPVVTNFYLTEGEKYGIGTEQSHERYEILTERLAEDSRLSMEDMRDTLDSVSKKNFGEFESTEWSIVFNQSTGDVRYYHRENYDKGYEFHLEMEEQE